MDKIAEFTDKNGFTVSLTTEKIFVSAVGQEETFALRSVSGVGLYDDIDKYNNELEAYKVASNPIGANVLAGLGVLMAVGGFIEGSEAQGTLVGEGLALAIGSYFYGKSLGNKPKPVLESYFTLMLSGGDRRFKFLKSSSNAKEIAKFINNVEETLTAYVPK